VAERLFPESDILTPQAHESRLQLNAYPLNPIRRRMQGRAADAAKRVKHGHAGPQPTPLNGVEVYLVGEAVCDLRGMREGFVHY
jgi:hypothetical protein